MKMPVNTAVSYTHLPLAAALGAKGESEMVLAKRVLTAQPEKSLLINDRYYLSLIHI